MLYERGHNESQITLLTSFSLSIHVLISFFWSSHPSFIFSSSMTFYTFPQSSTRKINLVKETTNLL